LHAFVVLVTLLLVLLVLLLVNANEKTKINAVTDCVSK
jgi:hypothetical protein